MRVTFIGNIDARSFEKRTKGGAFLGYTTFKNRDLATQLGNCHKDPACKNVSGLLFFVLVSLVALSLVWSSSILSFSRFDVKFFLSPARGSRR
jgi:hypothetical protein